MLRLILVAVLLAAHQVYCQRDNNLVRLVNGINSYEGRVEVKSNGAWGTVCDDDFDMNEANVICRMLGYGDAVDVHANAYYGKGRGRILLDQLDCVGDEASIFDCPINSTTGLNDCSHGEDVGIECNSYLPLDSHSKLSSTMPLPVRLTCPYYEKCNNMARKRGPDNGECGTSVHVEGIVQIYYNETWWYISADGWDNSDTKVVCGQLGYPVAIGRTSNLNRLVPRGTKIVRRVKKKFNKELNTVLMKNVHCDGTERYLEQCIHDGFSSFYNPNRKVATARCGFHQHPSCNNKCHQQPKYRLRGGVQPWMGRVEVLHKDKWGTVCDQEFTYASANVLCQSLGYGTARSVRTRAGYGRGIGKVWISQLNCSGTESALHKCKGFSWTVSSQCSGHATDVGVECNVPDVYYGQKDLVKILPAQKKKSSFKPFVEILGNNSNYGLLCYDDIDVAAAEAICRSLPEPGFLDTYAQDTHPRYKGQRYRGKFVCNGNETNIRECQISYYPVTSCAKEDLLIYCDKKRPDLVPSVEKFSESLKKSYAVERTPMYFLRCALEEKCLASDAGSRSLRSYRKLLRFDSFTTNYGLRDFRPVLNRNDWIFHQCHNHYHSFEVFVEYDLLSLNGSKVAEGHKASFCLEDSVCEAGTERQYRCGRGNSRSQGISVNCGDLYPRYLDCQWVDITGIPDGSYIIQVNVNPTQLVIESDHRNNIVQCTIQLQGEMVTVQHCSLSDHESATSC